MVLIAEEALSALVAQCQKGANAIRVVPLVLVLLIVVEVAIMDVAV
jgi:hypothetical protein